MRLPQVPRHPPDRLRAHDIFHLLPVLGALLTVLFTASLPAADSPAPNPRFVARAQRLYLQARENLAKSPTSPDLAVQLAKTCFDRAEFAVTDTERAALAVEGINACRQLLERTPDHAPAHLYLALNLGQLARTRTLGALRLVGEMEREFKRAIELQPTIEHAAPDRYLGQLYHQAPGWPTSIGSRARARHHLARACELSPDFPENRLSLLEALVDWNDRRQLLKEARAYLDQLSASQRKYSGEDWEPAWADWQQRWQKIDAFLAKIGAASK